MKIFAYLKDRYNYVVRFFRLKFFPKKLWIRSMLIVVMPVLLLQTVSSFLFYDNHWQAVSRRLALGIAAEIKSVITLYEKFDTPSEKSEVIQTARNTMGLFINFMPPQVVPKQRLSIKTKAMAAELIPALDNVGYPFIIQNMADEQCLRLLFYLPENTVEVFVPYKRFFSSTTYIFTIWAFVSSFLFVGIAVLFLRNQIRPILQLASAAENFGLGRDVENFKPEGATEVRQAAKAFIQMRDRIRRHIDDRTRMLACVSHDLRTPLTRMRLQLAMMGDDENVKELINDVTEMEHMVNGYLDFARGEGKEPAEPTDINRLISDTLQSLRREGTALQFTSNAPLNMNVRRSDFKRCLWNLVTNAQRYGNIVNVNMEVTDKYLEIAVEDNGPGIPQEKREDVFKAFFRLDESRNSQTGGVGLGLTITRDIVLAHGGKIFMEDSRLGGLRVVMLFPR